MHDTQEIPYVGEEKKAPLTRTLANARLKRVLPYLHGDILELGCGASYLLQSAQVREATASYTGVEALPHNAELLRRRYPQHNFVAFDLDSYPWPIDSSFHCIVALAVVEHLWNLKNVFRESRRLLRSGGTLVMTTPTRIGNDIVLRTLSHTGLVRKNVIDDHVTIFGKKLFHHACSEFDFELVYYKKFQFGGNQLAVLRKT